MNGWILLHKKLWQSENFRCKNKDKMFLVWIWLLTHANENGEVTFGRKQIADETGLKESSVWRAIRNIKGKMKVEVNIETNKQFTKIHIINWLEYQRKANKETDNNRTSSEQQPNTNKETKNKRIKEDISNKEKVTFPMENYNKVLDAYCRIKGIVLQKDEYKIPLKEIKLIFQNGRSVDEIITAMEEAQKRDWPEWTFAAIRRRIAELLKSDGEKKGFCTLLGGEIIETEEDLNRLYKEGKITFNQGEQKWQMI